MPPESIPPESWLDRLTRIDELLMRQIAQNDSIKETLTSILNAPSPTPTPTPTPSSDESQLIITYPEAGDTKEIAAGTARFDFFNGKVTLPTGTSDDLSDSLSEHDLAHCHSIAINAELPITIRIEGFGAFTTNAGIPFILPNIEFKRITITTTRKTNVSIFVSTSPKALHIEPAKFHVNNPYISSTTITTAGTENVEDIRHGSSTIDGASRDDTSQCLNENATTGYIYNTGPGSLLIEFHNGIAYSNAETLLSNMTRDLTDMSISKLRIGTTADGTAYILGAQ